MSELEAEDNNVSLRPFCTHSNPVHSTNGMLLVKTKTASNEDERTEDIGRSLTGEREAAKKMDKFGGN